MIGSDAVFRMEAACHLLGWQWRWPVAMLSVALAVLCRPPDSHAAAEPAPHLENPPTYCGVQALCRAMRALGKEVEFHRLVKPEYISSRAGSSLADLARCARDFGLRAEPVSHMTGAMLEQADCPILLHVKGYPGGRKYDHWLLFMGMEGGRARVYDNTQPLELVDLDALAARWDGWGLLVSNGPIRPSPLWTAGAFNYAIYILIGMGVFILVLLARRKWGLSRAGKGRLGMCMMYAKETVSVLAVSLVVGMGYWLVQGGLTPNEAAVAAIQDSYLPTFLPRVSAGKMAQLLDGKPARLVIDARTSDDYRAGHLPAAINIPVFWRRSQVESAMSGVPKDRPIIVYCHSNGCPYSGMVARVLLELGYENVSLFADGWVGWQKYKEEQE